MFQPKTVAKFAAASIAVYIVLTLGWHKLGLERAYRPWFRTCGNVAFSQFWFWSQASVRFLDARSRDLRDKINRVLPGPLPEDQDMSPLSAQGERDTLMVLLNRNAPGSPGFFRTASRVVGYAPTAMLVSLALATPVGWKRRLWTLLWGLVLVHLFIVFRLTIVLLHVGFAASGKAYALFEPGPLLLDLLKRGDQVLADNPTFSYLVSVFFWIAILFAFQVKDTVARRRSPEPGNGATKGRSSPVPKRRRKGGRP